MILQLGQDCPGDGGAEFQNLYMGSLGLPSYGGQYWESGLPDGYIEVVEFSGLIWLGGTSIGEGSFPLLCAVCQRGNLHDMSRSAAIEDPDYDTYFFEPMYFYSKVYPTGTLRSGPLGLEVYGWNGHCVVYTGRLTAPT